MLFLKGDKQGEPRAVYLLGDDTEEMIRKSVDQRLRDQGYPTAERAEIIKDMSFLRRKRLLLDTIHQQLWLCAMRGLFLALTAIILLGLKEYFHK